jgi:enolase
MDDHMGKILDIKARWILDSRAFPTVEAELKTEKGKVIGAAPSGASTGSFEALEMRDGGKAFAGKGVGKAVSNVNGEIKKAFVGKQMNDPAVMDQMLIELDGTDNKSRLGANATTAVSIAFAKAYALEMGTEIFQIYGGSAMPIPMSNVINGGRHAGNDLAIQEFMLIPNGIKAFRDRMQALSEIYVGMKEALRAEYGKPATNVGDEGGFAPAFKETTEALEVMAKAIEGAGYAKRVMIGMDCAASEFFGDGAYGIDGKRLSPGQLLDLYSGLISAYPILSIEDPFEENDFASFAELTKRHGSKVMVVGDDLFTTNAKRIEEGIKNSSANALLVKINQIGTVTEARKAAELAHSSGWKTAVSHRSGETEDTFISDFAVGIGSEYIKAGAPARGERVSKYNRLLRIEEMLDG